MNKLKSCLIGDVAEIIGGGTPSTKNEENFGGDIAWITPKDLSDHDAMYISKGERSITSIGLENSSAKLLPANSILFTSRAPIGYIALAKNEIATNQGFKSLILKDDNDPKFFYYLLKNITPQIKSYASGSTFQEISGKVLSTIPIKIPNTNIQKRIGEFGEKFDKKIELNKKNNETLERITKALFKSWFIDFDPVRAKAEGLSTGLPDEISDLFPDSFENSELGEIPKGWQVKELDEIADLNGGYAFKSKDYSRKGSFIVRTLNIGEDSFINKKDAVFIDKDKFDEFRKFELLEGDTLFVMVGATLGKIGLVSSDIVPSLLNQNMWRIRSKNNSIDQMFIYYSFSNKVKEITSWVSGSARGFLRREDCRKLKIIMPPDKICNRYEKIASLLFKKRTSNIVSNVLLVELRDTLLPRLVSGELRIPDAEKIIDEDTCFPQEESNPPNY